MWTSSTVDYSIAILYYYYNRLLHNPRLLCLHTDTDTSIHTRTHTRAHTHMAWKSVMSSTSHHALFLCSEVSEANGNSSFPPSSSSSHPNFHPLLPPFLLTPSSFSPLWSCTNLYWGRAPPKALSFLPCSSLFTLTASSLLFLSVSFYSCSLPPFIFCLISSIFQIFKWGCSIFFHCDLLLNVDILPASPCYSPPPPASLSTVPINQSPFLTFHSSSPASYRGPETKQPPIMPPTTTKHPPTLQFPTGPGWLIFLRRSESNRPPWC